MAKINCWEHKKCGREFGGANVKEHGVCPAVKAYSVGGIHGGKCGGRCCWAVTGTFCGGKKQGMYALKFISCEKCDFYQLVQKEEGNAILHPLEIIRVLEKKNR